MLSRNALRTFGHSRVIISQRCISFSALILQQNNVQLDKSKDELLESNEKYVSPFERVQNVAAELKSELKAPGSDINEVFHDFKDKIELLKQKLRNPSTMERSHLLANFSSELLQELSHKNKDMATDPYQVLNTLCQYKLARSQHFTIVLRYLLFNASPQDVIALWVKYLETISENSVNLLQNSSSNAHTQNIAITTIAYLSLTGNTVDIKILYKILQIDDKTGQTLPFNMVKRILNTECSSLEGRDLAMKNLNDLYYQYTVQDTDHFLNQIENAPRWMDLRDLYTQYDKLEGKKDIRVISQFMDKFIDLQKPDQVVSIYNQYSKIFPNNSFLSDRLLISVGRLRANSTKEKLDRILAVWNSIIKPGDDIKNTSYASLVNALCDSGNFNHLKAFWEEELPEKFKKDPIVKEAFLLALCQTSLLTYEQVKAELGETVKTTKLFNKVLLLMLDDEKVSQEQFNTFYYKNYPANGALSPTLETLSIKMYANYKYEAEDVRPEFKLLQSISMKPTDYEKIERITKVFISACPTIEPIRQFYKQLGARLNARNYADFISAEFDKAGGSVTEAEGIYNDFTAYRKTRKRNVDNTPLNALLLGFCDKLFKTKQSKYISSIEKYYALAKDSSIRVSNLAVSKILFNLATFARDSEQLADSDIRFVNQFLQDLSSNEGFRPNPKDVQILKECDGIIVPEKLA
ncbi:Msc6p [Saccharomyces eubayanus]|uniref:Msc6p n=1 Tax=Saccharomyces eubayanus TaxID=1080349 RepID=UPI0006C004CE|nr:MSC6-like protein [Saccharomyces eubayanus]KOG96826.1 MSC6-like protein [Saccharomyces eubayanus]